MNFKQSDPFLHGNIRYLVLLTHPPLTRSIGAKLKDTASSFRPRRAHSAQLFFSTSSCPTTSRRSDGISLMASTSPGSTEKHGRGGGGGGRPVTLEEIRRLSSPLMTAEIVFLEAGGGEMPELSTLFCVALRASCVRFRLRLPPSSTPTPHHQHRRRQQGHCLRVFTQKAAPAPCAHGEMPDLHTVASSV